MRNEISPRAAIIIVAVVALIAVITGWTLLNRGPSLPVAPSATSTAGSENPPATTGSAEGGLGSETGGQPSSQPIGPTGAGTSTVQPSEHQEPPPDKI